MSARIAVAIFPGTNSEVETRDLLLDCGGDATLVHWSQAATLASYDAYVLPGGFAYDDRIRAGAIAAHEPMLDTVIEGAQRGKLVLGICNGAQILLEAGLVPGTAPVRRPSAAFTKNAQGHYLCERVLLRRTGVASRCAITEALPEDTLLPAWVAHGEGRLAATPEELAAIEAGGFVTLRYANAAGACDPSFAPQGSALGAAGLTNTGGNVLALMPHPERDGWNFHHLDRSSGGEPFVPSGGSALFTSFITALKAL